MDNPTGFHIYETSLENKIISSLSIVLKTTHMDLSTVFSSTKQSTQGLDCGIYPMFISPNGAISLLQYSFQRNNNITNWDQASMSHGSHPAI